MNPLAETLVRLLPVLATLFVCVPDTASSLQLTMYSGRFRQTLIVDSTYRIQWYASEPTPVRLEYSVDSGRSWRYIDTASAGTFEYRWVVPRVRTTTGKFRVSTLDGDVSDVSTGLVTIDTSAVFAIYPNSGGRFAVGSTLTLQWWGDNLAGTVAVDVSLDSMRTWRNIASDLPAQNGRD